ncbi:MAG: hypothetical protein WCA35_17630 [Kovacikia sp.]
MSGSLVNKSIVVLHAIAITTAIAIFSSYLPLNSPFSQTSLYGNRFPGWLNSNH